MADNVEMEAVDEGIEEENEGSEGNGDIKEGVFIPGKTRHEGGELESDPSAYVFLHQLQAGAPCLSFDVIPDKLGESREQFPMSCYIVSGTQADRGQPNYVNVMKLHNITKTHKEQNEEDSEEDSEEEEEEGDPPELNLVTMSHTGSVNRLRVTDLNDKIFVGTWSETGSVLIHDITDQTALVDDAVAAANYDPSMARPIHTIRQHTTEGFAIDWSMCAKGWLATGDCAGSIFVSQLTESSCNTNGEAFNGHTDSVEDIQWSPNQESVFASCSVDRTIRIWDTKQKASRANMITVTEAHARDINVIHWNCREKHLVASGGDDGIIKIWDLRLFKNKPVNAIAVFKQHTQPITSLEWNPHDSSVLAVSGSDDQITIWDFSVEKDTETGGGQEEEVDVPPQLLFQHCGQMDMKELHWHPQLPGVIISTAQSDFNIFRTICV